MVLYPDWGSVCCCRVDCLPTYRMHRHAFKHPSHDAGDAHPCELFATFCCMLHIVPRRTGHLLLPSQQHCRTALSRLRRSNVLHLGKHLGIKSSLYGVRAAVGLSFVRCWRICPVLTTSTTQLRCLYTSWCNHHLLLADDAAMSSCMQSTCVTVLVADA